MLLSSHSLTVTSPAIPVFLGVRALDPVRLPSHESVNALFEYELLFKTPDTPNLGASDAADWNLNVRRFTVDSEINIASDNLKNKSGGLPLTSFLVKFFDERTSTIRGG